MTKKLKLSEFLSGYEDTKISPISSSSMETTLNTSLSELCLKISNHSGAFNINNRLYSSVISSTNSLYFFNEDNDYNFMIIFDPIIDIKEKNNSFDIFYYPDHLVTIILKESYVKEEPRT